MEPPSREKRIKELVLNLPEKPGCYQYLDSTGKIIYVGKAKNLKKRVSSYFRKEQQSRKTELLVSKIADIKYVVVNTEWDALLLENNLIKRYKPRYNILLKDDKSYPSICVTHEEFPRVFKTRKRITGTGEYWGPYSHTGTLNALISLFKEQYKLRTCRLPLSVENIKKGAYKECLEYHIKNCKAPCRGLCSKEEYSCQIEEIVSILKGKGGELAKELFKKMKKLAEEMRFEEAQIIKNRYEAIIEFSEKSRVVSSTLDNIDIYSIEEDENIYFINYMHVSSGCINQAFTFEYRKKIDETQEDMLLLGIAEMRTRYGSSAKEIIVPFKPNTETEEISWTVPLKGEKKRLLELSELNVKQYRFDRLKREDKLNPEQKNTRILKEMQKTLGMEKTPMVIECFDNSHTAGTNSVAACVVYEGGKPQKQEYRRYIIKSAAGGDDYGSMEEVLERRYMRLVEEGKRLPDLIIVDGGKGQIGVARDVLRKLDLKIAVAGLVKNNHHKTRGVIFGEENLETGIKPESELFRFLEKMQDEVHRFAIKFHKERRSKKQLESELTSIKGIGEKRGTALIKHFKSVKRVSEASFEELSGVVGEKCALSIVEWSKTYNV